MMKSSNTALFTQVAYEKSPVIDLREKEDSDEKNFDLDALFDDEEITDKLSLVLQPAPINEFSLEHDYKSAYPLNNQSIPYQESGAWIGSYNNGG